MSSENNEDKGRKRKELDEGMVKKVISRTIIGAIVIGVLITFVFNRGGPKKVEDLEDDTPIKQEEVIDDDRDKILEGIEGEEDSEQIDEGTVEGRAEKSRQEAKNNLERADEPVEGDLTEEEMAVLTEDLHGLFDHLAQDFSGFEGGEGDYFSSVGYAESIARQTEPYMGQQINVAQRLAGYKMAPETAEWFYSDTDEVYQFAVSLKSEGRDDLIFSGNYNKEERFFKVFKMHGTLDLNEFAS